MEKDIPVARRDTIPAGREDIRARGNALCPAVDIFETEEALTLVADLPGVDKDHLEVNLDRGLLTISGEIEAERRGEPLRREFALGSYYRQFHLPDGLDPGKTSAELKDGVLTLVMPKSEKVRPRRIEIKQ